MASWIITKALIEESTAVGTYGGNKEYVDAGKCKHKFRLLDDDRNVYFEGMSGNSSCFNALDNFGTPNYGCTDIQYFENGRWESL